VHWAPGIPRALSAEGEGFKARSRAHCAAELRSMFAIARDDAAFSTVIVRESGRSSIPEMALMSSIKRGVLDAPHARGMTTICGALCGF